MKAARITSNQSRDISKRWGDSTTDAHWETTDQLKLLDASTPLGKMVRGNYRCIFKSRSMSTGTVDSEQY